MSDTLATWNYCSRRAAHYQAIASNLRFPLTDFLEPLFRNLPFRLGGSSASIVIPCALDDQLLEDLNIAVEGLARLVRRRRDGLLSSPSGVSAATATDPFLGPVRHSLKSFDDPFSTRRSWVSG